MGVPAMQCSRERETAGGAVTDLKPCPFCGGTEITSREVIRHKDGLMHTLYWAVEHRCGNNPASSLQMRGATLDHAVARWNERVAQ